MASFQIDNIASVCIENGRPDIENGLKKFLGIILNPCGLT